VIVKDSEKKEFRSFVYTTSEKQLKTAIAGAKALTVTFFDNIALNIKVTQLNQTLTKLLVPTSQK